MPTNPVGNFGVGQGSPLMILGFDRSTVALTLAALVLVPVVASFIFGGGRKDGKSIPIFNPPGAFGLPFKGNREFAYKGKAIFDQAKKRFPNQPFKLVTNIGPMSILPPDRAREMKNQPNLSFRKTFTDAAPMWLKGGSSLQMIDHPQAILQAVISKHLTKRLNTVTGAVAIETTVAVDKSFGNDFDSDWTECKIYDKIIDVVARLSSRVFLGVELCRDEQWLDITKQITGELAECAAKGIPAPVYTDAIEWVAAEADPNDRVFTSADFQVALSVVAMHTTSDLLAHTLLLLARSSAIHRPVEEGD
ncbi:hypothetical protein PspLS_09444 [Pyricularia sp. CBS 133598]|nr:hypothetical protein PspLS_09444 [Pyricularia sp. CBS 133598]